VEPARLSRERGNVGSLAGMINKSGLIGLQEVDLVKS
jgi:hypothetical protein